MWIGAFGSTSKKASSDSSSRTFLEGMLPSTILQKMQSIGAGSVASRFQKWM
jgi:hypothetical protein